MEWWRDWNTTKIIIVSVILFVIVAILAFIIGSCAFYAYKRKKKNKNKNKDNNDNIDNNNNNINKQYDTVQQDTDIETDNEEVIKMTVSIQTDDNNEETKLIDNNDNDNHQQNDDQKISEVELEKMEKMEKKENIEDENKNEAENDGIDSDSDSHSDSEDLFAPGTAGNADTETPTMPFGTGTAGAMTYTVGSPGNDQRTLRSDSTHTFMSKASIKSSMRAAEMTIGGDHKNQHEDDNKNPDIMETETYHGINNNNILIMKGDQRTDSLTERGFYWEDWLKNTLQECFPDNWTQYLSHFKKQRITEDVLISLSIDKHKQGEIWKELIPVIGDRITFQQAWDNELMRRQLSKKT